MKPREKPGCVYTVMDARCFDHPDCSVEVVIDKGTLDSVANLADRKVECKTMLREVFRVLRPGGKYFLITSCPLDASDDESEDEEDNHVQLVHDPEFKWKVVESEAIQRNKVRHMLYILIKANCDEESV